MSNICKSNYVVKPLSYNDVSGVRKLDEMSGNYMSQWIEELEPDEIGDYGYGIYIGDEQKLVGYCSLGYADDCDGLIENHSAHTCDSLLLSDVYIMPEYRHKGYGLEVCRNAIKQKNIDNETVYLTLLYDELGRCFYSKLGFEFIDESEKYAMVLTTS